MVSGPAVDRVAGRVLLVDERDPSPDRPHGRHGHRSLRRLVENDPGVGAEGDDRYVRHGPSTSFGRPPRCVGPPVTCATEKKSRCRCGTTDPFGALIF